MKILASILLNLLIAASAVAAPEYLSLQERAQGRSLTGAALLNDSLYANPAACSFVSVYTVEGTYSLPKSFSASILDTRTSSIGGSAGYFRSQFENSAEFQQGLKLGFSGRLSNTLGVGVAGKAVWGPYQMRQSESGTVFDKTDYKDVDAGVLWNMDFLQLGATLRNILSGSKLMGQEREVSLGGRIGYERALFISGAVHSAFSNFSSPYEYGIGAEYVTPWFISLKGGYRIRSQLGDSFWSAGLSFNSPKLSVHYAVEFLNEPGQDNEHILGLVLDM